MSRCGSRPERSACGRRRPPARRRVPSPLLSLPHVVVQDAQLVRSVRAPRRAPDPSVSAPPPAPRPEIALPFIGRWCRCPSGPPRSLQVRSVCGTAGRASSSATERDRQTERVRSRERRRSDLLARRPSGRPTDGAATGGWVLLGETQEKEDEKHTQNAVASQQQHSNRRSGRSRETARHTLSR